jgi:uroporphyrinogen decarboxylase
MSVYVNDRHLDLAAELVKRTHAAEGLAPVDCESFWAVNDRSIVDPFSPDCPCLPLGIRMSDECVFEELSVPVDWHRLFHDEPFHIELCSRYNDLAAQIVGRRLLDERLSGDRDPENPPVKALSDIFEARSEWLEDSWSYWLHRSAQTEEELSALLDRVDRRLERLREFLLPPDWAQAKERFLKTGKKLPLYRHQRGPVTFAMSVFGEENLIYLIIDNQKLAGRFRDLIVKAILERARIIDEEAGYAPGQAPKGWSWADDNCALLSPDMYRFFGYPILESVFSRYAPNPGDSRYQHSDSAMGHLLPILGELGLTRVNFGPSLSVREIREHLPDAVIHGQLAPLTLSRNEEVNIVAETIRDFEQSREKRGLIFDTAGSVNTGSRLASLRLIMAAIREYCRYAT